MLKEIFNAITPEHLRITDNKLIQDAMEIFIQNLETNAGISVDLKNIFDLNNVVLKEELLKIYLNDLFVVLSSAKRNRPILDRINQVNSILGTSYTPDDFLSNITTTLTKEHFTASKNYKEKKGTKVAIEYIYNLVTSLGLITDSANEFKLTQIAPFSFEIEGSQYKEVYDQIVKPLAHPLGFTYVYKYILDLLANDEFLIKYNYTDTQLLVKCLTTKTLINFVGPNVSDADFNDGAITPPIYNYSDVLKIEETLEGARKIERVFFIDGTHVTGKTNPIEVTHYLTDAEDTILSEAPKVREFSEHCSMSLFKSVSAVSTIDDSMLELISDHIITDTITATDSHHILVDYDTTENYSYVTDDGYIGFIVSDYYTIVQGPTITGTVGLTGTTTVSGKSTDVYDLYNNVEEMFDIVTADSEGYIGFIVGKTFLNEQTSEGLIGQFVY